MIPQKTLVCTRSNLRLTMNWSPPDHPPRWKLGNFITNSAQAAERAIRDTSTYSYIHSKMSMMMMRDTEFYDCMVRCIKYVTLNFHEVCQLSALATPKSFNQVQSLNGNSKELVMTQYQGKGATLSYCPEYIPLLHIVYEPQTTLYLLVRLRCKYWPSLAYWDMSGGRGGNDDQNI